jgi:hypothetical protein
MSTFVHLFHILAVGTLFLYVGIQRDSISKWMYPVLFYLGILITLYHLYKVYLKKGMGAWVNFIHVFLIGPLLVYIGYHRELTDRLYYEILLMLGFASIGYHAYYLVRSE